VDVTPTCDVSSVWPNRRSASNTSWPAGPPLLGVLGKAGANDPLECRRCELVGARGQWSGLAFEYRGDDAGRRVPRKRPFTGDHFVEHAAEGEDICPGISRRALQLLRRHVVQGAQQCPCTGQWTQRGELGEPCTGDLNPRFREAEIEQLRSGLRQHDVAGLQVAVDDAGLVRPCEGVGDLDADLEGLVERELPTNEARCECFPVHVLHDEKVRAVLLTDVVECADVRVGQRRDRTGFAFEPLTGGGIRR
jgi:hypothetical protein